jgi:hypothetical protein
VSVFINWDIEPFFIYSVVKYCMNKLIMNMLPQNKSD